MNEKEQAGLVEAILFLCAEPVSIHELAAWMDLTEQQVDTIVTFLESQSEGGLQVRRIDGRVQLATNPKYAEKLKHIFERTNASKLSKSLLETLTIIAYRQPVTRQEIEEIRGVGSSYAVSVLQERGLVDKVGTKDTLGRPALFGTTDEFLRHFDLSSLKDLPPVPEADEKLSTLTEEQS